MKETNFFDQCLKNITGSESDNDENEILQEKNELEPSSKKQCIEFDEFGGLYLNEEEAEENTSDEEIELQNSFESVEEQNGLDNYILNDVFGYEETTNHVFEFEDKKLKVLNFYTNNNLTQKGLNDLLQMLDLDMNHKTFGEYFNINTYKKIYFCSNCGETFTQFGNYCRKCRKNKIKKTNYFYYSPVLESIQKRIKNGSNFLELIDYYRKEYLSSSIGKDDNTIDDIYKGSFYKKYISPISSKEKSISFTYNSDGVSPFKSSSFSFWPIFLSVNEMKPINRKKVQNVFLPVLIGNLPPDALAMALNSAHLLIKKEIKNIGSVNGIKLIDDFRYIADIPARSKIIFIKSGGYYFCHICRIKGVLIKIRCENGKFILNILKFKVY
jgi:hypothetical protein